MDSYLQRVAPIEYVRQNYSDAKILFPGHGQAGSPKTLLDEQLDYNGIPLPTLLDLNIYAVAKEISQEK
jgi:hypothetical protein